MKYNITTLKKEKKYFISSTMEQPKAHVAVAPSKHTFQTQTQTPTSKKRPFDSLSNSNSNYFKIRALIRDLRPLFIQVHIPTPISLEPLKIFYFSYTGFTCSLCCLMKYPFLKKPLNL